MTQKTPDDKRTAPAREDRLKAALKANLAKRKAQAKARIAGQGQDNNKTSSEGS